MTTEVLPSSAFSMLKGHEGNCVLVDVRSAAEFSSLHAEPAVHIPLESIGSDQTIDRLRGKKILCICQSGMRGKKAVETLLRKGFSDVQNVQGGTLAWVEAQLPTIKGVSSVSIERQVRIVAGALVLLGSLAGLASSSAFFAIPIFVGAGLMFAGITDTCVMALLLARCPWNKR